MFSNISAGLTPLSKVGALDNLRAIIMPLCAGIPPPPLLTSSWQGFSDTGEPQTNLDKIWTKSNDQLTERLELIGGGSEVGDPVHEGSVFFNKQPVCDRGWDDIDAGVVCRLVKMPFLTLSLHNII